MRFICETGERPVRSGNIVRILCKTKELTGPIALSVSIALAVLRIKTVLLKTEVLEFNTQLRTRLNVIAV